jgi:hypothetical protein
MLKWTIALILAASAYTAKAQTVGTDAPKVAERKAFYQLTFVVKEVDGGRVANTRTYYTTASTHSAPSSIRAGEKVPYASGEGSTTTWQQIDVGVAIDCSELELVGERLSLRVTAVVDSIAGREEKNTHQPVIRNNRWVAPVVVPLSQPTVIFSSDDPFSTQKVLLQLTVNSFR